MDNIASLSAEWNTQGVAAPLRGPATAYGLRVAMADRANMLPLVLEDSHEWEHGTQRVGQSKIVTVHRPPWEEGKSGAPLGLSARVANAVAIKAGPAVLLSKGMGLRAGNKPMAAYTRRPGERHGHNWYIPNVSRSSEFRHVAFDANSWKTFVHARLATIAGDHGALTLFGKKPEQHQLFAEHVADAESYVVTAGQGRTVHE